MKVACVGTSKQGFDEMVSDHSIADDQQLSSARHNYFVTEVVFPIGKTRVNSRQGIRSQQYVGNISIRGINFTSGAREMLTRAPCNSYGKARAVAVDVGVYFA